jgi:CheY-like chemotaxis protein
MRRTLNVKFLLCLVAGLIVASGGVALAHHLQFRRIPRALLRQALKAEDENDLVRTEDYLTRYLEFESNDIEQKAHLARLLTSKKFQTATGRVENTKAFFVLQSALSLDPDRQDLRRLFIPLAIQMNPPRLEDAQTQLKLLPHDAEASSLWGRWYEAKNDEEQAINSYREAVKLNASDAEMVTRFVRLLRGRAWSRLSGELRAKKRAADAREADAAMDGLIRLAPESWEARLARWNYNRDYWLSVDGLDKHYERADVDAQRIGGGASTVRQALAAGTVEQAERVVRTLDAPPDLILSDLHLGDGPDGIAAIEAVRRQCGCDVAAILITGDTSHEELRRATESGHPVLFKPVQPHKLLNALRGHIS